MKGFSVNFDDHGDHLFSKETQNQNNALQKTLLFVVPRIKRTFYLAVGFLSINFLQILSLSLSENFPINSGLMPSVHFFLKVFNFNMMFNKESNNLIITTGVANTVLVLSFLILLFYHKEPKQMIIKKICLKICLIFTTIYESILLIPFLNCSSAKIASNDSITVLAIYNILSTVFISFAGFTFKLNFRFKNRDSLEMF